MRMRSLAVASALALAATLSSAQAGQGFYVAGGGSGQFLQDSTTTVTVLGFPIAVVTAFDPGFGVNGALGYAWDSHGRRGGGAIFRLEGEVLYKESDVDSLTVAGVGPFAGSGDVSALGLMANAWYGFRTGTAFRPYIGAGVGTANISLNSVGATILGVTFPLADDDDWVFAYQFGAGLSYELTSRIVVGVEYRFFATLDPSFVDPTGFPFKGEYMTHGVGLNLRFLF